MEFNIPETGETIRAKQRPIVIITSNAEKELPDAFLRRCVFFYIPFPEAPQLEEIVRLHVPDLEDGLLQQAMRAFYRLRELPEVEKKPSTSELIDWLRALQWSGISAEKLAGAVPFPGLLLKKDRDVERLRRQLEKDPDYVR